MIDKVEEVWMLFDAHSSHVPVVDLVVEVNFLLLGEGGEKVQHVVIVWSFFELQVPGVSHKLMKLFRAILAKHRNRGVYFHSFDAFIPLIFVPGIQILPRKISSQKVY